MVSRELLEDVVSYYDEEALRANIMNREVQEEVISASQLEEVTVLTGARRVGKTFLMFAALKSLGGTYINFEDERLLEFSVEDLNRLYDLAKKRGGPLFLDEVQHVKGWERFAHRVHRRIKLYVSGSSAWLLSGKHVHALSGRMHEIEVRPLNFREFLLFRGKEPDNSSLLEYLELGGFPRVVLTGETSLLKGYFDTVMVKDILSVANIRYPEALRKIALHLLSNVGKSFTYRSLKKVAGISHELTVKEYVRHLKEAHLIQVINRYDPSLKKQESFEKKVYSVDHALALHMGLRMEKDYGRMLENIVFNALSSCGEVFFKKNGGELDFLLCKGLRPVMGVNVYFSPPENFKREVSPLKKLKKARPLLIGFEPPKEEVDVPFISAKDFLYGFDCSKYALK